jgi:hypothetical protein
MGESTIQRKKCRNRTARQLREAKKRRVAKCKTCGTDVKFTEGFGVKRDICSAACLNANPDTFAISNPEHSKTCLECFKDIKLNEEEFNVAVIFVCRDCIAKEIKLKQYENSSRRRAQELKAMPAWANKEAILAIYKKAKYLTETTGILHHVDHYYPLQSPFICGLHVAENLRVITASENLKKGNRMPQPRRETT